MATRAGLQVRFYQTPTPLTLRLVSPSRIHHFTFARLRPMGRVERPHGRTSEPAMMRKAPERDKLVLVG